MRAKIKESDNHYAKIVKLMLENSDILFDANAMEFEDEGDCNHVVETETSTLWREVRMQAAIAAMQGFVSAGWDDVEGVAKRSIRMAEELVKQLKSE